MRVIHKVVAHQPKVKADKTGTIGLGTLLELSKEEFDKLNDAYYNKEELFMLIASEDEIVSALEDTVSELIKLHEGK